MVTPISPTAGLAAALAQGLQGNVQGIETREQAQLAKKQATVEMKRLNNADQELELLKRQNQEAINKLKKQSTFEALRKYSSDLNVKHLNQLKSDGVLDPNIVAIYPIDPKRDQGLYSKYGLAPEDFDTEFTPAYNLVKAIDVNGKEKLIDLENIRRSTGYYRQLADDDLARQLKYAELAANVAKIRNDKGYSPGELEKNASYLARIGVANEKDAATALFKDKTQGNIAGQMQAGEEAQRALDELFNGDFLSNFNPAEPNHRDKALNYVERIERFKNIKFDSTERKELRDIGMLLNMSNLAEDISPEETGLFDSLLADAKKYISDEYGSEATAAYAAYRNVIRNALYGSALTDQEIVAFNEQFGSRKQKLGPLLKQFKTSLLSLKGKLDTVANMHNPYVVRYRLGVNQDRLDDSIYGLTKSIDTLDKLAKGIPLEEEERDTLPGESKPPLDSLL